MTHRTTDYRDSPADLGGLGDPGKQHPLDAMAGPIQMVKDISDWLTQGDSEETCESYRYQLRLAHRILSAAHNDLMPHRTAISALLIGHDPLREAAEAALLQRIVAFLDARMGKMTAYLAEQQPDAAREAEVRAKLAECEVMRRWVQALQSDH